MIDKLQANFSREANRQYQAMYSSVFGGITLDPALMVIPLDDHMVHRGHGVFDTAMLFNGLVDMNDYLPTNFMNLILL